MPSSRDVLELLQQVAQEVITPRFRALADSQVHQKNPGDFVTIADREAEVVLTRELTAMFPGCHVVGEEACFGDPSLEFTINDHEHVFTVDPVDGTANFVHGSPDHAVMVAEVVRGEQTRAWIWQPEHRVAYLAEKGAGAVAVDALGERHLTRAPITHRPIGATSKELRHGFDGGGLLAPVKKSRWCCGIDYPRLVTGAVDFLAYSKVHPWDHLPGSLLLREAGGVARTFDGREYDASWFGPGLLLAGSDEIWHTVRDVWGEPDR